MKNTHLEHVEDLVFNDQFDTAFYILGTTINGMVGDYDPMLEISTKFDGAPAIVFGCNPENGEFFVGTKSVFNKRLPKVVYSKDDAVIYYGDNPELLAKIESVFDNLSFLYHANRIPMGIYQGDLMFLNTDLKIEGKLLTFTPNTIKYGLHMPSDKAEEYFKSNLGIVIHTEYLGRNLAEMEARPHASLRDFHSGHGVVFIDPRLKIEHFMLTESQHKECTALMVYAKQQWESLGSRIFPSHSKMLTMFINQCIRIGEPSPDTGMYISFLKNRKEEQKVNDVETYREVFATKFSIHQKLASVKKMLLRSLNMSSQFYHEVNGKPCDGEGYVVSYNGYPVKLVDRMEFSRMNFLNKRFEKIEVTK